jgi:hypothetical protein
MPYITREDGERFIIPSYRDVLSAKKTALLKKEVLLLSSNYGEYITLQRKNVEQYEAAFSPDPGYLLGESIWHYFKRPRDLIYCEAIPNTSEAILVIVKSGSVYLDGSFPIDNIPDELVIFRTQQNNFEIYIYGDIPISQIPEPGKFSLDSSSIKSFNILAEPIFPTLPINKAFQLRLVDVVLKSQGIGVFPTQKIVVTLGILGLLWLGWMYLSSHKKKLPQVFVNVVNPFQLYLTTLTSPAPAREIQELANKFRRLYTIPGWYPVGVLYANGVLRVNVKSLGMKTSVLSRWAEQNRATMQILADGIYLDVSIPTIARPTPSSIQSLQQVIADMLDRLATIAPGNNLTLGTIFNRGRFSETDLTISFDGLTIDTFALIGEQLKDLPIVLSKVNVTFDQGILSGTITLKALGN